MKNNFFVMILFSAIMLGTMTGCKKDKPNEPTGRIPVNLRTDIKSASNLKVANDAWEADDKVGLYMKRAGEALTAAYAVYSDGANVQMSIEGGALKSTLQVLYPEVGNVDFIAYYPYNASVGAVFTVPVDVSGQAGGLPVEVLYSDNVKNRAPVATPVKLDFLYSLAKIEITVTNGENVNLTAADFEAMTASVDGFYTQATLQLASGTFTDQQAKQPIALYQKSSNATSAVFEALVLPATVSDGEIVFVFEAGGATYRCAATGNYAAATHYTLAMELEAEDDGSIDRTAVLKNAVIIPRNVTPRSFTAAKVKDFIPEMVFVQGGMFDMGGIYNSNGQVFLDSYSIGKYLVTQAQWLEIMGSWPGTTPSSDYGVGDNYPMYYVSWNDIVGTSSSAVGYTINEIPYYQNGFCYKLSQKAGDGRQYRLPTEAEWEYAARGGSHSQGYEYSGSNIIDDVAWYNLNSNSSTQPVGTKAPNELGIYDMSGNVYEWCYDWWSNHTPTPKTNPTGPDSGSDRMLRGGSWYDSFPYCLWSSREYYRSPDTRENIFGFRLAFSSN